MSRYIDLELEEFERLLTALYFSLGNRGFVDRTLSTSMETPSGMHRLDAVFLTEAEELPNESHRPRYARVRIGSRKPLRSASEVRFMLELLPGAVRVVKDFSEKYVVGLPTQFRLGHLKHPYGLTMTVDVKKPVALLRQYRRIVLCEEVEK